MTALADGRFLVTVRLVADLAPPTAAGRTYVAYGGMYIAVAHWSGCTSLTVLL